MRFKLTPSEVKVLDAVKELKTTDSERVAKHLGLRNYTADTLILRLISLGLIEEIHVAIPKA